jgi:alpha-tubulin suppressor-like RCC1 family protein
VKSGSSLLGAISLGLGAAHACAVLGDGSVHCWGSNDAGQLGDGTLVDRYEPVFVLGVAGARSVASGARHTCALLGDTTVRCWGANDQGQLGNGTAASQLTPVTVGNPDGTAPLVGVADLVAGEAFTCARMQDGVVLCWGSNGDCQLGQPDNLQRALVPVAAPLLQAITSLVAGSAHVCAVNDAGKAVCWGRNDGGQLSAPSGRCRTVPVEIPLPHVLSISAGRAHSCAIDEIGLWCWGDDSFGQLGVGIASAQRSASEPQLAIWPLAP